MPGCAFVTGGFAPGVKSRALCGGQMAQRPDPTKVRVGTTVTCTASPSRPQQVICDVLSGERKKARMSVLLPEKLAQDGIAFLQEEFQVDTNYELNPEGLLREIGRYEAIIVRSGTKVTREVIEAGKNLKVIGRAGVGLDNIDLHAAKEHGIRVVNAPTGNCIAAAEHTVALLCSVARHIGRADATLKQGGWGRSQFVGYSLIGKTLSVVGLGRIGREVVKRCQGLGMTAIAHDPYASEEMVASLGVERVSLETAVKEADYLTLHLPLTDKTRNLIDAERLNAMKPTAHLINAARGGIVNEDALLQALEGGSIAGAALDCFELEPPNKDLESTSYKLTVHPKVLATPHLGASTREAQEGVAIEIATNVRNALAGH